MTIGNSMNDGAQDAKEQIAQLREQVQRLMDERVSPAIAEAAERAQKAVSTAAETYSEQAEALSGRVREAPLTAMLMAAGIGYLLGRITR